MVDISYITSAYNSARFLDGLIANLLRQSHDDFEHIIVDSRSNDRSTEIIRKWQEKDKRIKLIEQSERTPYGVSWLIGWRRAEGKIVTNSNTDDRSHPWRGVTVMNEFNKTAMLRWVKHQFYYGGYETRVNGIAVTKGVPPPYTSEDLQRFFRCGVHVHWDNALRGAVDWELMFKAGREYRSAFDYWLVLYFMSLGAVGVSIPNCFSIYNQRSDSLEQSDKELNTFEAMRAINTFYPGGKAMHDLETKTRYDAPEFYEKFKDFLHGFDE